MRLRWLIRASTATGIAACIGLLASAKASAGTDVFSNIAPASPLGSAARFLRYPLSHYGLDQHFTVISASITGGVSVSGLLPEIAWFFASIVWLVTSFIAKVTIEIFAFSFNLDLVNGSGATGGVGALRPVSQAIHSIYANVFGAPWLVLAFSVVALWAMWRALVQRRYVETAGALALSLIYIVVAVFFVVEPGQTIGQASRWTNEMSQAFLSISDHGDPSGGEAATADEADQLWGLLVERPWSVLEFGGLEHCAINGTGDENSDPQSAPVRPLSRDAGQNAGLSKRLADASEVAAEGKTCINNANKYSSHFLRFGIGTDERNEEYDALNDGKTERLPEADTERAGYRLGVADKPATDAMEEGGQYQRLLLTLIVSVGETGAFLLLGSLAIGVILAQILLLLLLAFSPVALVAAAIPGRGHDFFTAWMQKLAGYLLRKAAYSLVLAILLAVNAAIADATSQLGWLFSFGLQAIFFWTVLIQRRTLTGGLIGSSPERSLLVAISPSTRSRSTAVPVSAWARSGGSVGRAAHCAGDAPATGRKGDHLSAAAASVRQSTGVRRLRAAAVSQAPAPENPMMVDQVRTRAPRTRPRLPTIPVRAARPGGGEGNRMVASARRPVATRTRKDRRAPAAASRQPRAKASEGPTAPIAVPGRDPTRPNVPIMRRPIAEARTPALPPRMRNPLAPRRSRRPGPPTPTAKSGHAVGGAKIGSVRRLGRTPIRPARPEHAGVKPDRRARCRPGPS